MILQERQPAFARIAATPNAPQIPRHAPLRDDEAELLKFSVDLGGSPVGVFCRQSPDQRPDLFGGLGPTAARPGTPAPVQPKTRAMPGDDRLGLDDDEDVGPTAPESVEGGPEEPVQGVQRWPRPFAFEYGEDGEDELRHELTFNMA